MNKLKGNIVKIEVGGHLSIVTVNIYPKIQIKAIVIDRPESNSYLEESKEISLLFKETEVVLGIDDNPTISIQNRIPGRIKHIEKGKLLSKVILGSPAGEIISVLSTNAAEGLKLKEEMQVTAMIKFNEVMLSDI